MFQPKIYSKRVLKLFYINKSDSKKIRKEIPSVNVFKTKRKHYIEDGVLFEKDIRSNIDNLTNLINAYKLIEETEESKRILQGLKYNLNKQIKISKGDFK